MIIYGLKIVYSLHEQHIWQPDIHGQHKVLIHQLDIDRNHRLQYIAHLLDSCLQHGSDKS